MLAFIKGYLLLSLVCTIVLLLIMKYDRKHYGDDPIDWN